MVRLPDDAISVPQQYALAGARFVLLAPHGKVPIERDWDTVNNYTSESQKLQEHIINGGNYGVLSANGVCCIDIDNPEEFKKYGIHIPNTFMVRRGSSGRGHIYFKCPDCPADKRTKHETTFGDIRLGGNFQTVGATCIHPDGDRYEILSANPIADIPWATIQQYLTTARERAPVDTTGFNLPNDIPEGGRNITLYKYGCQLRARGLDDSEIITLIQSANTYRCKPTPLPDDELGVLINSVLRQPKGRVVVPPAFPVVNPVNIPPPPQTQPVIAVPANYVTVIPGRTNTRTGVTTPATVTLNYAAYADFLKNNFSIIYFNKTIFIYDHGHHFYRPQTNEVETHIRNTVIEFGITEKLSTVITELTAHLKAMGGYTEYPFNVSTTDIPVENGIVRINYETEEISLLPHNPSHLFTYKLSVTYNPNIKNCVVIPLLKRMVELKDIKTLVQIPAQALLQMQTANSYKKAYLLQGEPHAGKTSYLKLLYRLFGDDFTSAISLQQLCENHFVGGTLEGKLLNIYDDLEDVALNVIDQFKTFTGDCRHGIERKYESQYTGKIVCVHCFTCNYPPEYPEKVKRDAAFWARWEYIKFPYSYGVNPNFYQEWYTDERISSFFNLILAAMITIRKRGLLSNSDAQEVMMNWSINSDHLYDFIAFVFEEYNGKSQNNYSKPKLHALYLQWCRESDIPEHKIHTTLRKFTLALQAHNILPVQIRIGKDRYEAYQSITYIQKTSLHYDLNVKTDISTY